MLIRIETGAGHGAGTPTSKLIEEQADGYAFLVKTLGMEGVGQVSKGPLWLFADQYPVARRGRRRRPFP